MWLKIQTEIRFRHKSASDTNPLQTRICLYLSSSKFVPQLSSDSGYYTTHLFSQFENVFKSVAISKQLFSKIFSSCLYRSAIFPVLIFLQKNISWSTHRLLLLGSIPFFAAPATRPVDETVYRAFRIKANKNRMKQKFSHRNWFAFTHVRSRQINFYGLVSATRRSVVGDKDLRHEKTKWHTVFSLLVHTFEMYRDIRTRGFGDKINLSLWNIMEFLMQMEWPSMYHSRLADLFEHQIKGGEFLQYEMKKGNWMHDVYYLSAKNSTAFRSIWRSI